MLRKSIVVLLVLVLVLGVFAGCAQKNDQPKEVKKNAKLLRQAINYAIDREALIELVKNGRATPAKGVLPPGMFGYNPDLKGYTYDPEKAKELLKEAGYPDGIKLTLQYNTSDGHKRIAEALQQQLKAVGIDMELKNVDWGAHLDSVENNQVPFFRMGWVVDYPDPDNFLYVLLCSDNIGPKGNYTRFSNPKFDELVKAARVETDPEKRLKLYQEAEQIVVEEAPWVFIYHYTTHQVLQNYVKGYKLPSFGAYSAKYTDVWMEKDKTDKYGGVFRYGMMSNPPDLDPVHATDTSSSRVINQMFETLVGLDSEGNVIPLLAESWDAKDGKVFTFHLRKGVKFHATTEGGKPTANGGREVTADDWVWTFNYICNPETNSERAYFVDMIKGFKDYQEGKADKLEGVKKIDDYTLQIELEYPFAPFISVLTYNTFVVLPKEDVEKWGDQFNFHPVGTGPFKFEEWVQDQKVVLSKNESYWMKDKDGNPLPYMDGIEFRVLPELSTEWTEFTLGNLEAIDEVDDPYYKEAKEKYQFYERPQMGTYYYGMNVTLEPFKD